MKNNITVAVNAGIYTMKGRQKAQAIAWENFTGTILAIGNKNDILDKYKTLKAEVIDLKEKVVLPGFTDCHTHFCNWCLLQSQPDLEAESSIDGCLRLVEKHLKKISPGEWLTGTGWNRNIWTDSCLPDRHDLDKISKINPVALWSKDWHALWVNSLALKMLGIDRKTPEVPGGKIERDKTGYPNGLLREEAANRAYLQIPPISDEKYRQALLSGQRKFAKMGLTGFHSMEGLAEYHWLMQLGMKGQMILRGVLFFRKDHLDDVISLKFPSGWGGRYLRLGGLKLFVDGSLGSQTALMLKPYEHSKYKGMAVLGKDELYSLVKKASESGLSCAIHAIGDAANKMALDVYGKVRDIDRSLRHRIEHCQLVKPEDIRRFKKLGIIASVQPLHCPSDLDIIEKHWGKRGLNAYPFGSLAKTGVKLAFGSDAPIEVPDPFLAIQSAVTRQRVPADRPTFYPEQRMSLWDSLKAYTIDAAYASGDESWKGTLEPGKVADFICLSEDIFKVKPEEIYKIRAGRTFIGGREV
jgi:predicted amidohydrolase YtcJ